LRYLCDDGRHLVCLPYFVQNLHVMAEDLGLKRHWYHWSNGRAHYDIPRKRITEIMARCELVSSREILAIVKGERNAP